MLVFDANILLMSEGGYPLPQAHLNGGTIAVFRLKQLLKSVGWVHQSSSDGTTFSLAVGNLNDVITHAGSGVGGLNNAKAWFTLKKPDDNRQICFQIDLPDQNNWRIKYSRIAGFTGGAPSAIRVPAAADERFLIGTEGSTGTDAAPIFDSWFGFGEIKAGYCHIAADNAAPYGWWMAGYGRVGSSSNCNFAAVFDPLVNTSPGDVDPYAFYFSFVAPYAAFKEELQIPSLYSGSSMHGWFDTGGPNEAWIRLETPIPFGQSGQLAGDGPQDLFNNKVHLWPMTYMLPFAFNPDFSTNVPTGPKGTSTLMAWHGGYLSRGQALRVVSSRDKIVIGNVVLDWNGTLPLT